MVRWLRGARRDHVPRQSAAGRADRCRSVGWRFCAPGNRSSCNPTPSRINAFGVRYATLRWISPASSTAETGGSFRALADLDDQILHIGGQPRAVLPGMGGQASIVVGRRSLASYALEPLRQMREVMSSRSIRRRESSVEVEILSSSAPFREILEQRRNSPVRKKFSRDAIGRRGRSAPSGSSIASMTPSGAVADGGEARARRP